MKKVIYIDKINEEKERLLNISHNDINDNIESLKKAVEGFEWNGPAYKEYISNYNDYINKFTIMNNKLELLALFLKDVANGYYETNLELNEFINKLLVDRVEGNKNEV